MTKEAQQSDGPPSLQNERKNRPRRAFGISKHAKAALGTATEVLPPHVGEFPGTEDVASLLGEGRPFFARRLERVTSAYGHRRASVRTRFAIGRPYAYDA